MARYEVEFGGRMEVEADCEGDASSICHSQVDGGWINIRSITCLDEEEEDSE